MFGLDLTIAGSLLIMAGNTVACTVPRPPNIIVNPVTNAIQYEYMMTSEELNKYTTSTVSPYAPNVDSTTGGLRHDRPKITTEIQWGRMDDSSRGLSCLWYDTIRVTIELSPKIYIARDKQFRRCKQEIIDHEVRHVDVDRQVINKYSQAIGLAVKNAVDKVGAMGPYNQHEIEHIQNNLVSHIHAAINSQKLLLFQEMSREQAKVDSLEEYERISRKCSGKR
jgi:hypothetical protein